MEIGIFKPAQYGIGTVSNIQLNKLGNRVSFRSNAASDSFETTNPGRFFNELEIKKMISDNPELKKFLENNKIPTRLNMTELLELKEKHCQETQDIAQSIVNNLPQALKQQVNIKNLKEGAILHDFGKVLIPPEILNKNGTLTPEEHKIMDLHSELGYQLLKNTGLNEDVLKLIRYHHYEKEPNFMPDINVQILNLADKYSALTEKRVYKEAFSEQKALTIIYSDVKNGNIHPFLFNALVKAVQTKETPQKISA